MSGYGSFAAFYDRLMTDVDYRARASYLLSLYNKFRPSKKVESLLDLACGTGNLLLELMDRGFDVIGVDGSQDMLAEASVKAEKADEKPLLLCQDMRQLDLYGTVDCAVCTLDSLNHICRTEDLAQIFKRLFLFIEPGGLFLFDVNTIYKHRQILGNNSFVFENPDFLCTWRNSLSQRTNEIDMQLDFFIKEGEYYRRFQDSVKERAYAEQTLRKLLLNAGFETLAVYDDMSFDAPRKTSERLLFAAMRK